MFKNLKDGNEDDVSRLRGKDKGADFSKRIQAGERLVTKPRGEGSRVVHPRFYRSKTTVHGVHVSRAYS